MSFLSLTWAYIADIDFSSEKMRFLGSMRFEVYGLFRGMFQKRYPASLQFTNKKFVLDEGDEILDSKPLFSNF
jgi:sphingosine kinase